MALWIFDRETEEYRLLLVTPIVGLEGSSAIYRILHEAHRKAAVPRDFDPWMVEVIEPDHQLVGDIRHAISDTERNFTADVTHLDGMVERGVKAEPLARFATFLFGRGWVYFTTSRKPHTSARSQWKHFSQNVEQMAA